MGGGPASAVPGAFGHPGFAGRAKAVFPSLCTDRDRSSLVESGGWLTEDPGMRAAGKFLREVPWRGPASTGSDQAQKGRLVDALAIRGDEGRGTLR